MNELSALKSQTVWQALEASCARVPDRDALVATDDDGVRKRLTYTQLRDQARALSVGLVEAGVRRGDRIVLWMTNRLEWVVSYLAAARLGAAVVPVNTFLKPPEIAYIIAQSGARHLIMLDRFRKLDLPEMLREICPAFGRAHVAGRLFDDALPDLRTVIQYNRDGGDVGAALNWRTLGETASDASRALAEQMAAATRPDDLAMVKYTSGSTGFPKGVMLEQGGIVANVRLHSRRVGVKDDDVFFSMMPFFHGGGSIWGLSTMLVNGGTLVFTEAFNADFAADLIADEKATIMFGVLAAEVVEAALRKGRRFESLRVAFRPNEQAVEVMPNARFNIFPFGLTETYGPAAASCPDDPPDKQHLPRMLEGNELRVVDPETEQDVAPGVVGEAWMRGNMMRGYWNKPEATAKVMRSDGWFRSEDLIKVDEQGYIQYVGRLKLMLKVGGENVAVEEVENAIVAHPDVKHCCVVGVADKRKVEAVRAYVVRNEGADLEQPALVDWLRPRIAHFKLPRDVVFIEALPRLANGKIDRVTLQKMAREEEQSV